MKLMSLYLLVMARLRLTKLIHQSAKDLVSFFDYISDNRIRPNSIHFNCG